MADERRDLDAARAPARAGVEMAATTLVTDATGPIKLTDPDFLRRRDEWYDALLERAPVSRARISFLRVTVVARHADCTAILTDSRFLRNRGRAKGRPDASPFPFPLPPSVAALARSMILEDDPAHRRLRSLVNQAFTSRAVAKLSDRVEAMTSELLDRLPKAGEVDLLEAYARPIPTRVIAEMVGLPQRDMETFEHGMRVLTSGLTGFRILRTLLWDLRGIHRFFRELVARKRGDPGDDVLSRLIAAEQDGERLSEDELVAMVFLLIVAGFETTQHLIANGVRALLEHPDQLERLRGDPALWEPGVEEIVRLRGPIHGTKPMYPTEDVTLHGVTLKRGAAVMPLLGAANRDPRVFDRPEVLDVSRSPNHHLGFGFGMHYCLGRPLALMEARIALARLFEQAPDLRLAVDPDALEIAPLPGWHRHVRMPVRLR